MAEFNNWLKNALLSAKEEIECKKYYRNKLKPNNTNWLSNGIFLAKKELNTINNIRKKYGYKE